MENIIDKNALAEIFIILNRLNLYNKLPIEFQEYININKNSDHKFDFNEKAPLLQQLSNSTTKNLLSYIHIKYIENSKENRGFFLNEVLEILEK